MIIALYILFVLLVVTPVAAILFGLAYLPHKFLRNTKIGKPLILLPMAVFAGYLYTIIGICTGPGNDYYKSDFEEITGLALPEKSFILSGKTSPPFDLHGSYSDAAMIIVDQPTCTDLLKKVDGDKRSISERFSGGEELDDVAGRENLKTLTFRAQKTRGSRQNVYYFIGFLDDGNRILIEKVVS